MNRIAHGATARLVAALVALAGVMSGMALHREVSRPALTEMSAGVVTYDVGAGVDPLVVQAVLRQVSEASGWCWTFQDAPSGRVHVESGTLNAITVGNTHTVAHWSLLGGWHTSTATVTIRTDIADADRMDGADALRHVLLHELLHALGVEHTDDPASVMYPEMPEHPIRALTATDVTALRAVAHKEGC